MYTILTTLFTLLAIGIAAFLMKFYGKREMRPKWFIWAGYALCYAVFIIGMSFGVINLSGKHMKAASTGIFIFILLALVLAVLNIRLSGIKLNELFQSKGGEK